MIDWDGCRHVVRREDWLSGNPALVDDPRITPDLVSDNMDDGMTAQEVKDAYDLRTPLAHLEEIQEYANRAVAGAG